MIACIGLWGYENLAMDRKKLTRELGLYIKQNYRSEGFKLKDFFDAIGDGRTFATGTPSAGGAKWVLSFLLDKMELTSTVGKLSTKY